MSSNSLAELAENNQYVKEVLESTLSSEEAFHTLIEMGYPTSSRSVRRWRARHLPYKSGLDPVRKRESANTYSPSDYAGKGSVDVSPDGCQINNVVVTSPILDDWGPVFELFNLDASVFEVVDDTVRMSTWQQSARNAEGDRDTIQLYSYSARFRRKTEESKVAEFKIKEWHETLRRDLHITTPNYSAPVGRTYAITIADPQLGKKGTDEAVENWKNGVTAHADAICDILLQGSLDGIHIGFMGDETENIINSYTNQVHTIELNRSQQLELDFDLTVWTIKTLGELGLPLSVSSVISNHGEWTRNGGKDPVTTRNDNSSTFVRRQAKKMFDELHPYTGLKVDWTIGDSRPGVVVNLSGVNCYFSHGYVEKGRGATTELKVKNAVESQILGDPLVKGDIPLWFMAHYHHYYQWEDRGRAIFGCPALEAERSSEYMMDQYGVWSPPGMLGVVVGGHNRRGWSDLNIF